MPTTHLTEADAFYKMAEIWKLAEYDAIDGIFYVPNQFLFLHYDRYSGFCTLLRDMNDNEVISYDVMMEIKKKITKLSDYHSSFLGFKWSINTEEGKQARIQWCLDEAAKLSQAATASH